MSTRELLTTTWDPHPTVLAGCLALAGGYRLATPWQPARGWLFLSGTAGLALSLVSPLDTLGDRYLFSAHMLQHLILILLVPPLLLLGTPPTLAERLLRPRPVNGAERLLGRPAVAWLIGAGTMWAWHLPAFYDAALRDQSVHILQHLTFLVSATVLWWPVLCPAPERQRLGTHLAMLYLFAAALSSSILGIIITFAPTGLYEPYLQPIGDAEILRVLRADWGLTPDADQQLGGLLMWVPGGLVYLLAMLGLFARWHGEPETDLVPPAP